MMKISKVFAVAALAATLITQEAAVGEFLVGVDLGINRTQYKANGNGLDTKLKKARFTTALELGYDALFCDSWVVGVELRGGATFGKIKKKVDISGTSAEVTIKHAPYGAILGRGGYSMYPGGVAYVVVGPQFSKHKIQLSAGGETGSVSKTKPQFVTGLGFRHSFEDWFVKLEYDHAFKKKVGEVKNYKVKTSAHIFQLGFGWKA
jgi:hypothetical protein